jgi:RNA polymerase sigma-70 factor (ECF subfamily)
MDLVLVRARCAAGPIGRDSPQLPAEEDGLIRAAQEGDRQAFAALVERYWDRLFRWLYHLTHNRHTAEDLAQEAFLKGLGHLDTFRAGTNFRAWLFRIAHNAWANQARRAARDRRPVPDDLPGRDDGPVEQALTRESLQLLARAVGRLPAEFRSSATAAGGLAAGPRSRGDFQVRRRPGRSLRCRLLLGRGPGQPVSRRPQTGEVAPGFAGPIRVS